MDFRSHRLTDLAHAIRRRELSAREVVGAALDRIEALDGEVNAFVAVDAERALRDAADVDQRLTDGFGVGPLAGIPLAVKDLEDAAGLPTRYGSALASDEPAAGDSVLVARLRAAGCVVVGKTATPEYGHKGATDSPAFGATRNPWALGRTPGGSSGGSSAALAAGMVPLATGSDGGGSIRIPSALTGLSGIKTSQGRVPNGGPNAPGSGVFTVKGPMAARIADVAKALDVVVGPHPTDPFSLPRSGAPWYDAVQSARLPDRVVWSPTMGFATVDDHVAERSVAAIGALEAAGVEVILMEEIWPESPLGPWLSMWTAMRARTQGHLIGTPDWERVDPSLRQQIEWGTTVTGTTVIEAMDAIHHYNLLLEPVFEQAPILLTPATAGQAPAIGGEGTINGEPVPSWVEFTFGFNLTRNPAGVVPIGTAEDGMPLALQVVGNQRDDVGVLQAIRAFEDVFEPIGSAPFG